MADLHQLTDAEVGSLLARAGETAEVEAVVPLRAGAVGALYEIWRRRADPLVLKLYPAHLSPRMRTEAYVYGLLADMDGVPTPQVVARDDSGTVLPLAYLLMTRLEGVRLADVRDRLSEDDGVTIHRQMGQILRRIHSIRFAQCGEISGGELIAAGSNADYVRAMFARQLQDFDALGGLVELRGAMRRFVARHDSTLTISQGGVLCHNDYVDGNIHVTRTGHGWQVSGVVDVERAVVADPLFDVARTTRTSSAWSTAFGAGYGVRAGVDDEPLALYELYHVLELWNWFATTNWAEQLPELERDIVRRVGGRGMPLGSGPTRGGST